MILLPAGRFNGSYGFGGYGDLYLQASEYGHTINFNTSDSRTLYVGGVEAGIAGAHAVVVLGGFGPCRPVEFGGGRHGRGRGRIGGGRKLGGSSGVVIGGLGIGYRFETVETM